MNDKKIIKKTLKGNKLLNLGKLNNVGIKVLDGANLDIDLTSAEETSWKQMKCPWNESDKTNEHKCAVKNISICPYFCGVEYLDNILCCYPNKNKLIDHKLEK